VKEDLGFTVVAFGLVMMVHARRCRRAGAASDARSEARAGLVTALVGIVALFLVLGVVIPAFNPEGAWAYWGNLSADGGGTGSLASRVLGILTPATKVNTLVLLAALVAGACAVSGLTVLAVPTLAWRFLSSDEAYWGTGWHYSMILMPIVFTAAIDALRKLRNSPSAGVRRYARVVPAASAVFAVLSCLYFPLGNLFKGSAYEEAPRAGEARAVLAMIPHGASVASDYGLITRLPSTHTVYWLGALPNGVRPEYVLIDPAAGWSADPGDPARWAEKLYPGTDYVTVYGDTGDPDGYRLARLEPPARR
jgi:hypothetical protein